MLNNKLGLFTESEMKVSIKEENDNSVYFVRRIIGGSLIAAGGATAAGGFAAAGVV